MRFFNRSRDADNRKYEYNERMEVAKLGRKQSRGSIHATNADTVNPPPTNQASKERVHSTCAEMVPDRKMENDTSIFDSYRTCRNLWAKTLFCWATSPSHCHNLLKILHNGDQQFLNRILSALRSLRSDLVNEITNDVNGCHLVRKLVEVGNEDQCLTVLKVLTRKRLQLINIGSTSRGKIVVQKMLKLYNSFPEHRTILLRSLEQDPLKLAVDRDGQSVILKCLRYLSSDYCEFIFETLVNHLMQIVQKNTSHDGFGGVLLVRQCFQVAPDAYQKLLVDKITDHALALTKDPVGHYLILDLLNSSKWIEASRRLVRKLQRHFSDLAMQHFSSKVVHQCLIKSSSIDIGMSLDCIVRELIRSPLFPQMPLNIHAQSVIKSACALSEGKLLEDLNEAIRHGN
ncbi:hypothetical protein MPTK2_4g00480 [Marchantia polymorpha subsp. ruderalis]